MRSGRRDNLSSGSLLLVAFILLVTLASAKLITGQAPSFTFLYAAAIVVVAINILSSELALYILIFSMLLSPEIILGTTTGVMAGARGVTIRLDDILLFLIGFTWLAKMAVTKDLGLLARTPINRQIFLYILVSLVATIVGVMFGRVNPKVGFLFVLKYFEYFFIFFMVINLSRNEMQVKRYLVALLLVCFIISVIGVLQIPTGQRVTAPFEGEAGEPNTLGGYLVLMMSVALGLLVVSGSCRNVWKWALLFLLLIIPLPLFFTLSRSSWAAAFPVMVALLLLGPKKRYLLLIVVGVMIVIPPILPQKVKDRVSYTFRFKEEDLAKVAGVTLDPSASARVKTWQNVSKDFLKHPFIGYGVTGYEKFVDAQYIRVLVESGTIGLLSFLWLMASLFRWVYGRYRADPDPFYKGLTLGFLTGTLAMLIHSVGANTFIIVRIMEPYWFLAALVIVYPALKESQEKPVTGKKPALRTMGVG